jgi:hypothetical protein
MPEYPQIAIHVREAINQVYNGTKEPEEALDEAAAKSAKLLDGKTCKHLSLIDNRYIPHLLASKK